MTTKHEIYEILNHWYSELCAWIQVIQEKGLVQEHYLKELQQQVKRQPDNPFVSKKQLEDFRRQLSLLRYDWGEIERLLEGLENLLGFLYLLGRGAKLEPFVNVQKGIPFKEDELQSLCSILLENFPALFEHMDVSEEPEKIEQSLSMEKVLEQYAHNEESGYAEWMDKKGYSVNIDSVIKRL